MGPGPFSISCKVWQFSQSLTERYHSLTILKRETGIRKSDRKLFGSVIGIVKCDKKLSQSGVADSGDEFGSGD